MNQPTAGAAKVGGGSRQERLRAVVDNCRAAAEQESQRRMVAGNESA
jgi:hypothetical protein